MEKDKQKRSEKHFDEFAESYDTHFFNALVFSRVHKQLQKIIYSFENNKLENKYFLDVGCGTGNFLLKMAEENPSSYFLGVDISKKMIEIAKSKNRFKNLEFRVGDIFSLPEEKFDYITSCFSFHHWPNQQESISRAYNLLNEGGKLIIADLRIPLFSGEGTTKVVSAKEMKELFQKGGFAEVKQYSSTESGKWGIAASYLGVAGAILSYFFAPNAIKPFSSLGSYLTFGFGLFYSAPNWVSKITLGEKIK